MSTHRYADYWYLVDHVVHAMYRADRDPYREATILADASDYVDAHTTPDEATRIWSLACQRYDHEMKDTNE